MPQYRQKYFLQYPGTYYLVARYYVLTSTDIHEFCSIVLYKTFMSTQF